MRNGDTEERRQQDGECLVVLGELETDYCPAKISSYQRKANGAIIPSEFPFAQSIRESGDDEHESDGDHDDAHHEQIRSSAISRHISYFQHIVRIARVKSFESMDALDSFSWPVS